MNDLRVDFFVDCHFSEGFSTIFSPVKEYNCVNLQRAYSFG